MHQSNRRTTSNRRKTRSVLPDERGEGGGGIHSAGQGFVGGCPGPNQQQAKQARPPLPWFQQPAQSGAQQGDDSQQKRHGFPHFRHCGNGSWTIDHYSVDQRAKHWCTHFVVVVLVRKPSITNGCSGEAEIPGWRGRFYRLGPSTLIHRMPSWAASWCGRWRLPIPLLDTKDIPPLRPASWLLPAHMPKGGVCEIDAARGDARCSSDWGPKGDPFRYSLRPGFL
ncbi:hypothetical protein CSHISOI_02590 [Colletotrichum shisoi]|uniref:Uncharacterized protein n=1 Tax=Colletotrichum shisoi TaxID=2078593 RepID=A0A5Q4C2W9_9PEZI|nr:hypothetical protein CSHISOI_02590 [Colletotrichum shisoi]